MPSLPYAESRRRRQVGLLGLTLTATLTSGCAGTSAHDQRLDSPPSSADGGTLAVSTLMRTDRSHAPKSTTVWWRTSRGPLQEDPRVQRAVAEWRGGGERSITVVYAGPLPRPSGGGEAVAVLTGGETASAVDVRVVVIDSHGGLIAVPQVHVRKQLALALIEGDGPAGTPFQRGSTDLSATASQGHGLLGGSLFDNVLVITSSCQGEPTYYGRDGDQARPTELVPDVFHLSTRGGSFDHAVVGDESVRASVAFRPVQRP